MSDGRYFEGEFKKGKQTKKGKYFWKDGTEYIEEEKKSGITITKEMLTEHTEKEEAVEAEAVVYMHKDIQYHTDKIPSDVTVPDDATVKSTEKDGSKLMRRKLNPDYDESIEYESREDRDEWVIVGLLGQIQINKGQPLADSWIKMKDVSDSVEMYFVK